MTMEHTPHSELEEAVASLRACAEGMGIVSAQEARSILEQLEAAHAENERLRTAYGHNFSSARKLAELREQLEAAQDALQRIYWRGCDGEAEEIIISVLSPEQRAEWAKTTSKLGVLDRTRTTRNDVGDSNPASEPEAVTNGAAGDS